MQNIKRLLVQTTSKSKEIRLHSWLGLCFDRGQLEWKGKQTKVQGFALQPVDFIYCSCELYWFGFSAVNLGFIFALCFICFCQFQSHLVLIANHHTCNEINAFQLNFAKSSLACYAFKLLRLLFSLYRNKQPCFCFTTCSPTVSLCKCIVFYSNVNSIWEYKFLTLRLLHDGPLRFVTE